MVMAMDPVNHLIAELRKCAPAVVRVYDAQDEARDVAVPNGRKRWSKVAQTIEARPWVRAELLDKRGAALGYVANDGPADDLEDISASPTGAPAQARWMMELMLRAQQVALSYRDKEHAQLLASVREVLDIQGQGMREMIALMRAQRDEAMELATVRAAAAQGDDMDQLVKLLEASPKLMSSLGPLIGMFLRPKLPASPQPAPPAPPAPPPAKPNGAPKGKPS